MKTEFKQKLSVLALNAALVYAVAASIVLGAIVVAIYSDSPRLLFVTISVVVLTLAIGVFCLSFLAHSGCRFSDSCMVISRPLTFLQINYDSVSHVERVTRSNTHKTEKIRLTFNYLGKQKILTFTPESPAIIVSEILFRCPQLTSSKTHRLKRDRTFRAARETLSATAS